jgi:hypothetical protein
MKVYIKEKSRIARWASLKLKTNNMAVTLGHTIYLHNSSKSEFLKNRTWVCHELAHVKQFERYGIMFFLLKYSWESLVRGYYNNCLEVEARAAEHNTGLLQDVDFV